MQAGDLVEPRRFCWLCHKTEYSTARKPEMCRVGESLMPVDGEVELGDCNAATWHPNGSHRILNAEDDFAYLYPSTTSQ
jgi:hypothetical protein